MPELDDFKLKVVDPQTKKVEEADEIMLDENYKWRDDEQKILAGKKLENYKLWLAFYLEFYKQGLTLVNQHETLTNNLAKWYAEWYDNISNEGKQEREIMSAQADLLSEIFCDIYKELQPLKLDIKPPLALNLK